MKTTQGLTVNQKNITYLPQHSWNQELAAALKKDLFCLSLVRTYKRLQLNLGSKCSFPSANILCFWDFVQSKHFVTETAYSKIWASEKAANELQAAALPTILLYRLKKPYSWDCFH